jgi:hypothetical protein
MNDGSGTLKRARLSIWLTFKLTPGRLVHLARLRDSEMAHISISKLYIGTPTLEHCSPEGIMIIFANPLRLVVFPDYCSIRCP